MYKKYISDSLITSHNNSSNSSFTSITYNTSTNHSIRKNKININKVTQTKLDILHQQQLRDKKIYITKVQKYIVKIKQGKNLATDKYRHIRNNWKINTKLVETKSKRLIGNKLKSTLTQIQLQDKNIKIK